VTRHVVLGYPVDSVSLSEAAERILELSRRSEPRLVVTLNPEIVVQAQEDRDLARAIQSADLVVADGIGIVWAARRAGVSLPGRVPGVELTEEVLRRGGSDLRVYLLGGRPGVAERAGAVATQRWGTTITGCHHGYFRRTEDVPELIEEIRQAAPDLLLAGLGPGQEQFLAQHKAALGVPVSIGVGGTLDVMAGTARRTPSWTRRAGLEWAWRVGLDPKRWHRIPRLVRFAGLVLRGDAGSRRQGP
jgi:N-acetylglucosaminyldiphosphoundecaprenol N-acetyl-beta-D-mannosaminyltransferase